MNIIPSLEKLTQIISRLPGIGGRTAMRLALYLFESDKEYLEELKNAEEEEKEEFQTFEH